MTKSRRILAIPALLCAVALGACTPTYAPTGASVPASSVQRASNVQYGTITDVRTVAIRNQGDELAGVILGGVVGGVVGNQFGNGRGNTAMTAIGATTGAVVGANMAANNASYAQEWTVRLNNGRSVAIVQNSNLYIGQPVQVIYAPNGTARIAAR